MVSANQMISGLRQYINKEILPQLDGTKRIGAAVYLSLMERNAGQALEKALMHPAVQVLGIVDEQHQVDVDALHDALIDNMIGDKFRIEVPMIGTFTLSQTDIDRIYDCIVRADK